MLALITINLLPGGRRGAAHWNRGRRASLPRFEGLRRAIRGDPWTVAPLLLAVLAVGHLGFGFVTQGAELARLEGRLGVERQDSVRYAELMTMAGLLAAQSDTLARKARVIREIDEDRFVWAHILNEVSRSLPEYTWLTSVRQTDARGGEVEFRLEGMAGGTAALTRFMRGLEDSPFVERVRLISDEQVQQGPRLVHSFVLLARYEVPDSSAIVTEPILLVVERDR